MKEQQIERLLWKFRVICLEIKVERKKEENKKSSPLMPNYRSKCHTYRH
jgi:hypothetical protein